MGDKISDYPSKTTIHGDDLLDFSNTEDSGASYNQSQKVTVDQFMAYINSNISSIYNSDGNINENRILTSNGSFTKWLGGDVSVQMDNEIDDYGFLINASSGSEFGRFGMDTTNGSGVLELSNVSGTWFDANDGTVAVNTDDFYIDGTTNRIGIGMTTPTSKLHIQADGNAGLTRPLIVEDSAGVDIINVLDNGDVTFGGTMFIDESVNRVLITGSGATLTLDAVQSSLTKLTTSEVGFSFDIDGTGGRSYVFGVEDGVSNSLFRALGFDLSSVSGQPQHRFYTEGANQGLVVLNDAAVATGDVQIKGDTNLNLFYSDASVNGIGIGTSTPNSSSIIEFSSVTKGVRYAPMTAAQASAITPVEGLVVFTSDTNGTFTSIGLYAYENGSWNKL